MFERNGDNELQFIIPSELEYLNLSNQIIDDEKATAIAEAIKINQSIISFSYHATWVSSKGVKAFAEALKINISIISIDLSKALIGDEGAKEIAEVIKINMSIKSINLSNNQIGDKGAKAIAEALKVNRNITSINLSYALIGKEGAKAIAEAIKQNSSILYCTLSSRVAKVSGIQEHILSNRNKFHENLVKVERKEILTSEQYHTSLSQFSFIKKNEQISFPFMKGINLEKIIKLALEQIIKNFFPIKGVCKNPNPLYRLYGVSNEIFSEITKFIPLYAIHSHKKNIIGTNDNQNALSAIVEVKEEADNKLCDNNSIIGANNKHVLNEGKKDIILEIERRLKVDPYRKLYVDAIASTSLVSISGMLIAVTLESQVIPVIMCLAIAATLLRKLPVIREKTESFVERIIQSKAMTTIALAA